MEKSPPHGSLDLLCREAGGSGPSVIPESFASGSEPRGFRISGEDARGQVFDDVAPGDFPYPKYREFPLTGHAVHKKWGHMGPPRA